jgi:acyl transferase domain-containing protein/acyl carrier protein
VPAWAETALAGPADASEEPVLVLTGASPFGAALAHALAAHRPVIEVAFGAAFEAHEGRRFTLRATARQDYERLAAQLAQDNCLPGCIVHAGSVGMDAFEEAQQAGLYSLLALVQAFGARDWERQVPLLVVTAGAAAVHDGDRLVPAQAPAGGVCTVISQEYLSLRCRHVDIGEGNPEAAEHIVAEALTDADDRTVAYRAGRRFVRHFEPLRLETPAPDARRLRENGVYLIAGGLGAIGLTLAEHLARTVAGARLVLLGRSTGSREAQMRVAALRAGGTEVLVLQADVTDAGQMAEALDAVDATFGALHGVVYAAGNLDARNFRLIRDSGAGDCDAHVGSKARGLSVMEQVLGERPHDFFLVCSSLSVVLGGMRCFAYAAANSYADAFAAHHNRTSATTWTVADWDMWDVPGNRSDLRALALAAYAMRAGDATEAFERVIHGPARIVNSTGDLQARLRQWVHLDALRSAPEPSLTSPLPADPARVIAEIWRQMLGVDAIDADDNFFDLGGNSLIALQLVARLNRAFGAQLPVVTIFEAPTINTLAALLRPPQAQPRTAPTRLLDAANAGGDAMLHAVAIIGMAGRFPGADTIEKFWENLRAGVESVTRFSDEELVAAGVDPALLRDPAYVKARPMIAGIDLFDAGLFGYSPRQAELLDPQQRLFHECGWEALERAGYDSQRYRGAIGIFAGAGLNSYLIRMAEAGALREIGLETLVAHNDKDALTTALSYKLNLRGPSVAVQTFCSTSLVAVHMACQSLRARECDMALAGGVSIWVPGKTGYLYRQGDQFSPDGHCRSFDADAGGTVFGDGVALVVLKRLDEAVRDGDTIHAVIRGSAINNDGGLKVSYTAPSVVGQASVIEAALADAGVSAADIDYVEAHGTATRLGDPIEVAALSRAFKIGGYKHEVGSCAIGSVKTNVGHLDRAAGVTGLIKTVLALQHGELPASLHFRHPNPEIDFASSPFRVNETLAPWRQKARPRRAGVNALGVGGTNAHVVLEQAPAPAESSASERPAQLLVLSAATPLALTSQAMRLGQHIDAHPDLSLADVAYTLALGRRELKHRRFVVCHGRGDVLKALQDGGKSVQVAGDGERNVVFVIGSGLRFEPCRRAAGRSFYHRDGNFRAAVDACSEAAGVDLSELLYGGSDDGPETWDSLPPAAQFAQGWALAALWHGWGVAPTTMAGSGVGELVAACFAGVMSLGDALGFLSEHSVAPSGPLKPPARACFSCSSGDWLTGAEAVDPSHWKNVAKQQPDDCSLLLDRFESQPVVWLDAPQSVEDALARLGTLWARGVPVDWEAFYAGEQRRRIELPTYPFERRRYWFDDGKGEQPANSRRANVATWFSAASWKRAGAPVSGGGAGPWLLFADAGDFAGQVAADLERRGETVRFVWPGSAFRRLAEGCFTVRPGERADYDALLCHLQKSQCLPARIAHFWMAGTSAATLDATLEHGFYSLLALAQALGDMAIDACRIDVVTTGLADVTGLETMEPAKAAVLGPCQTIQYEYGHLSARVIDIEDRTPAGQVVAELLCGDVEDVALRGRYRWKHALEPAPLATAGEPPLHRRGAYLITGGLGGLGLTLAEHLAQSWQARLVLIGRTGIAPRPEWKHIVKQGTDVAAIRRIETVRRIEDAGGEALIVEANVCDADAMRRAVDLAVERFGALHGAFHLAGVPGSGLMQLKTREAAARVLAPKVQGMLNLTDALAGQPLDFLLLFSSVVTAAGGGPGQADYCAANAFLDAFARAHATDHGRTIALSWGEWQWDAWQDGLAGFPEVLRRRLIATREAFGIDVGAGMKAIELALGSSQPHLYVTTRTIADMIEDQRAIAMLAAGDAPEAAVSSARHPRPVLGASYVEPGTALERRLATVWQLVLGIDKVGLDDNFFELGGNSLLGASLVDKIKRMLGLERLAAQVIFESPTVAALARQLDEPDTAEEQPEESETDKRRARHLRRLRARALREDAF